MLTVDIGLAVLKKVAAAWMKNKGSGGDLVSYTASSRVEPICLIDSDVVHHEMLPDVMQSLQSIFSGYYLQAIAISATVGRVSVIKQLDKLNPQRIPDVGSNWLMAMEAYQNGLPRNNKQPRDPNTHIIADVDYKDTDSKDGSAKTHSNKEAFATVRELTNLSVGKMIEVEITDGTNKATVPISIRLMATNIPTSSILHILSLGNKDATAKERYHGWKSGRLEFIRDIVLCQDLIDAHKKNLMADSAGIYSEILKRRSGNAIATLTSGEPSLATASNLLVCSRETIRTLEGQIGQEFKNPKVREKIFAESYLMIIAVIDKEWDRLEIYHRGISIPTSVSLRDIRTSNKGSGPDVAEILKAYQMASAPSL